MSGYVVVIGAANIDIGGTPNKKLIPADSNPGTISITYGGVGRNIANNLSKLGVPVKLITAVGGDSLGRDLLRHCEAHGIDTTYVRVDPDDTSSMYLYINNDEGDMELAIDHIKISRTITPEYIRSVADVINGASIVVADGNISKETFLALKEICKVPIYEDPVSTALAMRIKDELAGIDTIKPNCLEAEYLTGMTIRTEADHRAAAEEILNMGVKKVFISMGPEGMLAADKDHMYIVGECPAEVVCTTGAGDSATAAIVWASLAINDLPEEHQTAQNQLIFAAKAANAVASMTIGSEETIAPELSPAAAMKRIQQFNMSVKEI